MTMTNDYLNFETDIDFSILRDNDMNILTTELNLIKNPIIRDFTKYVLSSMSGNFYTDIFPEWNIRIVEYVKKLTCLLNVILESNEFFKLSLNQKDTLYCATLLSEINKYCNEYKSRRKKNKYIIANDTICYFGKKTNVSKPMISVARGQKHYQCVFWKEAGKEIKSLQEKTTIETKADFLLNFATKFASKKFINVFVPDWCKEINTKEKGKSGIEI